MARRPATRERVAALREDAGRSDTAPNGSHARSSKAASVREVDFDEPSTGVRRKSTPRPKSYARALEEARVYAAQIVKGLWVAADAAHLVGLYSVLHEHVYGTPPLELAEQFLMARASAEKLAREGFGGDYEKAQRFVAWCWGRVARRERRRDKADVDSLSRPGWRLQFKSRTWLTDYRASGRGLD